MSLTPELVNVCLTAEGFPRNTSLSEVVRLVTSETGAAILQIAQLNSADSSTQSQWLLHLRSHDDQIRCLLNHRRFQINQNSKLHDVKLNFPEMTLTPQNLKWVIVDGTGERAEEEMSFLTTDDTASMDNISSTKPDGEKGSVGSNNPNLAQFQGLKGPPMATGLEMSYQTGQDLFLQGNFQPYVQAPQQNQLSFPNPYPVPHAYTSNLIHGGMVHHSQEQLAHGMMQHQHYQENPLSNSSQQHPMGRGSGMTRLSLPQSQSGTFPRYSGNEGFSDTISDPMVYPGSGEGKRSLPQAMDDLNLTTESFPSSHGHHHDFYDASIITLDENESNMSSGHDFEAISRFTDEDSSIPHHHFYLRVTELPPQSTEKELWMFFEDRRQSGGGPIIRIDFDQAKNSAAIFFKDHEVIQRVVQKSPLLLNDKMIKVELASTETQATEPEIRTVEIRGMASENDIEMFRYYFENPAKGGGDIEDVEWNEEENILFITFEDPEVAKRVANSGHKIGGSVLEVNLYSPPVEEPEESQPQCKVEVRNFDPTKTELYEMYFSNPNKGGDTIVDLTLSEDKTVMIITFETPEVAQRVAEKSHKVGGAVLDVIIAPIEDPTPPSTILVKGCDLSNTELYQLYFENPKKGGGEVTDVVADKELQGFLITFADPEVAQEVVTRQHKVSGRDLEVSLYTPKKSPKTDQKPQEPVAEEEAPPCTVVVSLGQSPVESEETYLLYFESPRYGGGEVEMVEIDEEKKLVFVTFVKPEVAERVASKQHKIAGQAVEVKLYVPPKPRPTYTDKLLFRNVADSTTQDCLRMYVDRVTGMDPVEMVYSDEVGTVLVTFEREPDFAKVVEMTQKRQLEKRKLTVSKVPISNCLLVENLSANTTEDTVGLYFENKRSGGGTLEKIEMVPEENRCYVYFENHEVLDDVLKKSHTLDKKQLRVKRYMECLGQSGGSNDPTAFTMPKPLILDSLDRFKVAYLRQSHTASTGLFQQLSACHGQGKFEGDTLIIHCTLSHSVPKARLLSRTWTVDVKKTVCEFLSVLEVLKQHVIQQLWQEISKHVSEAGIKRQDGAVLFTINEECTFVVVGMKSMAQELYAQVCQSIKTKETEIEKRKQEVKETNSRLQPCQLSLLLAAGFHREAEKRHEGLRVKIDKKRNSIEFHGLMNDVSQAQLEMYDVLNNAKKQNITDMSDLQKKVLSNAETKDYIVQKFKKEKISASWELGHQGELEVSAFSDPFLVKAIHIIRSSVPEHVCQLSPESSELLVSAEMQLLISQLQAANPGILLITPATERRQVCITCIDVIMHGIVEEVDKFLAENTIYSQTVRFSPSRQQLVATQLKKDFHDIGSRLRAYKIQLSMIMQDSKISIKGTRKGLDEVMKHLDQLNKKIICHEEVFTDPSKVKLLSSDCEKDLKMIGRSNQCVLALQAEDSALQVIESSSHLTAPSLTIGNATSASVQLPSGVTISVVEGDITQLEVGAIVNAANSRMDHAGGLARDIVKKGGEEIQRECHQILRQRGDQLKEGDVLVSGPGRLRCQCIIHAVGPIYKGGNKGEEECLFETIMNCLQEANNRRHTSIAIPAVSTGIFGYPAPKSTQVIMEAVKSFFDAHRRCDVKSVYLCHTGSDIVGMFVKALHKEFPSAQRSSTPNNKPAQAARRGMPYSAPPMSAYSPAPSRIGASNTIITVSVIPGELAKQSTDVIVNTTSKGLDLSNGAVSSSILNGAGPNLQQECMTKYPQGIATGAIARTTGHNLQCQEIFHIVLCNYSQPNSTQLLSEVVKQCLLEASRQQYSSVAFPVLGTGNLAFPAPIAAQTMLGAILQFEQAWPSTSLRDVRIIVYPSDQRNLQAFQNAQRGSTGGLSSTFLSSTGGSRSHRVFDSAKVRTTNPGGGGPKTGPPSSAEFDIGGLRFIIKKGDITEENTDAIVNSTNSQLDLTRGGVSNALKRKCGQKLVDACKMRVPDIQTHGIAVTRAFKINCKIIIHMDADKFSPNWEQGIEGCLKVAEDNGVQSIAMPAIGTGIGLSPSASAMALFKTVVRIYRYGASQGPLQEIRVVLFDTKTMNQFVSTVQQMGESHNKERTGFFSAIKSVITGRTVEVKQTTSSNPAVEQISLFIYAAHMANVHNALTNLDEFAKDKFTRKEVQDEVIHSLEDDDIRRITQIGQKHDVELNIQQFVGRIVCDGLHQNVFECMQEITTVIRQAEQKRQARESALMLANMVRWCYLEVTLQGTEQKEYELKENHIIEMAYKGKKTCAEIEDNQGNVYVIDFNSMKEFPQDNPNDTVSVMRKDIIQAMAGGQLPDSWDKHSGNETVKVVPLQPTTAEYQSVANSFMATAGNVGVVKISRIQNPHLYHQYLTKKDHLERQNVGIQNERSLWHGTSADAIDNINHHGFNRSFCGKNATVHGEGVYFAVNASYSAHAKYSPPDMNGHRHVYQCKVLVGHPTQGRQNLRVLPARQGPILYDSATDNINSPSMFVIFNDTQAYPEYMITFQ